MENQTNTNKKILTDLEVSAELLSNSIDKAYKNDIPYLLVFLACIAGCYSIFKETFLTSDDEKC